MANTFLFDTRGRPSQNFMPPEVLQGHLGQLRHYADLKSSGADPCSITNGPTLPYLVQGATHGGITGLTLDTINEHVMVGLSVHGEKPRFLFTGDFIAIHLGMAFGMPLTLQKNGKGFAYLRFRTASSSQVRQDFDAGRSHGRNIYLLPVIANAGRGRTVQHLGPLAELSARSEGRFDHHYLGRDALVLRAIEEDWEAGRIGRSPKLGRVEFIAAALFYFDRNAAKSGLPITRKAYGEALTLAFSLADWRYGPVGYGSAANHNSPHGTAV